MTAGAAEVIDSNQGSRIPPPHPVRQILWDALFAMSLANLCLVRAWYPTLSDAYLGYFNQVPVRDYVLLGLACEGLCFSLVVWVWVRILRRVQLEWAHLLSHLAFFCVLVIPVDFIRVLHFGITDNQVVVFLRRPLTLIVGLGLLVVVLWRHRLIARTLGILVGILSPLALVIFGKVFLLLLGLTRVEFQPGNPSLGTLLPVRPGQPRVLWVLFDETDQRLAFEKRPPGVNLPELDRLRSESLFAENASPPGDSTLQSVPGLISGRRFSAVAITDAADLKVTLADDGAESALSALPSIFASARHLGVNSAIVGWYHPYDRLYGTNLSFCAWHPFMAYEPERGPTFWSTLRKQLACFAGPFHIRRLYVDLCQAILPEAIEVATNSNYGLVFLHLPLPHSPGIYLPEENQFTIYGMPAVTGYFNNLVLADHWLGAIRRAMESRGVWDSSWVILSSDHSWRKSAQYDGIRDLRVPFIVKPPGHCEASVYAAKFNTVITHDLVLRVLNKQIASDKDLLRWLDTESTGAPPGNPRQ